MTEARLVFADDHEPEPQDRDGEEEQASGDQQHRREIRHQDVEHGLFSGGRTPPALAVLRLQPPRQRQGREIPGEVPARLGRNRNTIPAI